MSLKHCTDLEKEIIHNCLIAASKGSFFEDWEFHTLFGITRNELNTVLQSWPNIDESDLNVKLAINNSIANLFFGYPHNQGEDLKKYIQINNEDIKRIYEKWKEGIWDENIQ